MFPPRRSLSRLAGGAVLLALLMVPTVVHADAMPLRVGYYENPPKIHSNEQGEAVGFFPALLRHLAEHLERDIEFIRCEWADCLDHLRNGRIDIMPDVAHSPARGEQFRFNQEPLLQSWSYLYSGRSGIVKELADIHDRRVAILNDSIQYQRIREMARNADWSIHILPTASHDASMQAVVDGDADIAIVNRFFGEMREQAYDLFRSEIVFQVSPLYLAFSDRVDASLIERIDTWLALLKADPDSVYYTIYKQWLTPTPGLSMPQWIYWLGLLAGGVLIMSIGGNAVLRRRVSRATHALQKAAYEDALTGTLSRAGFTQQLAGRLTARSAPSPGFMAMLDIININEVNNTQGYAAGDELLRQVGRRLQAYLGPQALVARLGDDEFLVYEPLSEGDDWAGSLQRVRSIFEQPFQIDEVALDVRADIGYTLLDGDVVDVAVPVRQVELALNQARASQAFNECRFTDELQTRANERIQLTRELRQALLYRQFELHYQPKVMLADATLIGSEVLLRWQHPRRGLLMPGTFIPVAEQSQLIAPIGDWVLDAACRTLRRWRERGLPALPLSVNVSIVQFDQGQLVSWLERILQETAIDPASLTLEITESVFARESEHLHDQLGRIRAMGVRLSLDDFGTGYSSMMYLQRYPFDEVKIDRAFVQGLPDNPFNQSIITSILGLARTMNADVIAEGVETAGEAAVLERLGCRQAQGFHFGRPLSAGDFEQLMGQN